MPGGGNPDYSALSTWEAVSDNSLAGYTGPVVLDCYDSQVHDQLVMVAGATNTSGTVYRAIRSSPNCAVPWAGKQATGANFKATGAAGHTIILSEHFAQALNIAASLDPNLDASYYIFSTAANIVGAKFVGCVAYDGINTAYPDKTVGGFSLQYCNSAGSNNLAFHCIAKGNTGSGFMLRCLTSTELSVAACCTALGNGGKGFDAYGTTGLTVAWSCYAANNTGGDFDSAGWDAPSGWNASKDNSASLGGVAGDNYKNGVDLITAGKMNSYGIALASDLFANGAAGDRYGRNPYDDFSGVNDLANFLKNDTSGDPLSKKDVKGTDRPTPDTADVSWNVGASEIGTVITAPYDDGTPDGGIVFGGEVVETTALYSIDGISYGGIVFGGEETSSDELHQVDGVASGGIVFGGGDNTERWVAEPNNWVAVKGGTYRISGVIYTLAVTMSYEGLGDIAALVNCAAAPTVAGTYRYDLLSVDAAGDITVTAGAEATVPVMPTTPASSVKLNHVLRYYGQTSIVQSDIGKIWLAPQLATLTAAITDDELAWAEMSTTITITCRDQYGQLFTGSKTVNAAFESGNGTIAPLLRSGGGSAFVFTYTRGGNDPGDISPMLTFSSSTGALCVAFIILLDAGGAIMI